MKKNEVEVKKSLEIEAAAAALEDLAASLRAGTICVEKGEQYVTLKPAEVVDLELKAAQKKNKNKFVMELTWREVLPADEAENEFKISSKEPEPPVEEPVEEPMKETEAEVETEAE